ncbi:unnamed protein product, partial [marine sediment metagenome]
WKQQDPYFFEALGGVIAGEHVNLSSGFLPDSDVAPDVTSYVNQGMADVERDTQGLPTNEKYVERLKAAPGVWSEAVSQSAEQAALGRPLTELARVANESVIFSVPKLGGGTSYTPWSPGRITAATITEPGSANFHKVSGTGDFLAQIFADPIDYLGLGWAKMGRAGRLLKSESFRAADEILTGFGGTGKLDGTRAASRQLKVWGPNEQLPMSTRADWHAQQLAPAQLALPAESVPAPLGVADAQGRAGITEPAGGRVPWWRSPSEQPQTLGAFDPPSWYVDTARAQRNSARGRYAATAKVKGKKTSRHWKTKGAGNYTLDLPQLPGTPKVDVKVRRVGKGKNAYWDVLTPDGKLNRAQDARFSEIGPKGFATLDEAKAAANNYAYGSAENLKVHGMSPDEFENSGEAFYIQNGQTWLKNQVSIGPQPDESITNLRKVNRSKPFDDNNMKVVVFGRTA